MSKNDKKGFASRCIHDSKIEMTTTPQQLPIFATSSYAFDNIDQGIDIFAGKIDGYRYSRYANPTVDVVAKKIAALESYNLEEEAWGVMTSSGMSAISTALAGEFQAGDHILTQGNLYGGTTELLKKMFQKWGILPHFINLQDLDLVREHLENNPAIKGIYFETPANPTLACVDIRSICTLAKEFGKITLVDNTFLTPYLQRPLEMGVDYVIHSTTKFLNGHGTSIAGIVVGKDPAHFKNIWTSMKLMGTNCSPFEAWLTNNGIKTLQLRMDKHCANAMALAQYLEAHDKISKVNYNGLPSHADHALAKSQSDGYGGMLSFEINGGLKDGITFMNGLEFCSLAPTLGDVDTLILHPASSSHLNVEKALREENGISDGLIRVSVGIENIADIIGDVETALSNI